MKTLTGIRLSPIILLGLMVFLAAPTASARTGYVACNASDDVVPFDMQTYVTGTPLPLPYTYPYPYDATMTADTTEVWVVDASGDHVVVIDVANNAITHTIPVGEYPNSVCFTDDGSMALVSARDGDVVTLIRTSDHTVAGTLPVLTGSGGTYDGPGQLALDPHSGNIYAVDWYDDTLYEIDRNGSTVLRSVDIGNSMWQIVCDPSGVYLYITDRADDVVRVVNRATLTEVRTVPVGDDPWGLDVTIDGSKLVVSCEDNSTAYVIDTSDWSTTAIPLGSGADPRDVDILEDGRLAFVTSGDITGTDVMYVIDVDSETLVTSFEVGGNPSCIAVEPQMCSAAVGVAGEAVAALRLRCHPNPFNPKTTISYYVPERGAVSLCVYDVTGRKVATLEDGIVDAGEHTSAWSGRTDEDSPVATGVYFVRLEAAQGGKTVKSVLLK